MSDIEPHQAVHDEYALGARAVIQRIGDLMITIEDDTHRAVINALYLRLINEGVPAHPDPVDRRIVRLAVLALAVFGDNLTRTDVAAVLPLWALYDTLTPAEVDAIVDTFPEPPTSPLPGDDWLSGPSTGGADQ